MRLAALASALLLAASALAQTSLEGPRQTLEAFLKAQPGGSRAAAGVFVQPPSEQQVRDLAELLEGRLVDIEDIPSQADGRQWLLSPVLDAQGRTAGVIEIVRGADGQWRFSEKTRRALAAMAAAHRAKAARTADWKPGKEEGPSELATPRRSLMTFLTASHAGRWSEAAQALDLSEVPALAKAEEGRRLAAQMLAILNRVEIIPASEMPDQPLGPPYTIVRIPGIGPIEMERSREGSWLTTPASIALFDRIWREVRDRPILGGRRQVGEEEFDPGAGLRRWAPEPLRRVVLGLEAWQWGVLGALLAAAFLAGLASLAVVRWVLRLVDRSQPPLIGKQRRKGVSRSLAAAAGLLVLVQGDGWADLPAVPAGLVDAALSGLLAAAVVALLWAVWAAVADWTAAGLESRSPRLTSHFIPVIHRVGQAVIAASVLVFLLSRMGVDPTALATGLGLGGLLLGLAAKDTVENFIGSALILFERPFAIGDWIKIGDAEGTVEDISLRSTRIRTFTDSQVTLPNSKVVTGVVENIGRRRKIRVRLVLPLPSSDAEALQAFCSDLRTLLSDWERILPDGQVVKINEVGASGPSALVIFYLEPMTWAEELDMREQVILKAVELARTRDISIGLGAVLPG